MKTEQEIKSHIKFLKEAVLTSVDSEEETLAVENQIEALKWVLRKGE